MTWAYTAQIAVYAAIIGIGALAYVHWLARSFERKWGKETSSEPDR